MHSKSRTELVRLEHVAAKRGFLWLLASLASVAIFGARSVVAEEIFSNYGPNNATCACNSFYSVGAHPSDSPQSFAVPFVVPTSSSFTLDTINMTAFTTCAAADCSSAPTAVLVLKVASDSGGSPGTTLESFTFNSLAGTTFSSPRFLTGHSTLTPPLIGGRKYWVIADVTSPTTMTAGLMINGTGTIGLQAFRHPNQSWVLLNQSQIALRVTGARSNAAPPVSNFSWPPSPNVGQDVLFTDTSTGNPTSWEWNFGDGGTSALQNPTHRFASAATYAVKLTVSSASGSDATTKTVVVTAVSTAPVAKFSWSPLSPVAGAEVQFSDTSTGSPTSWSWVFGDGGTSTSRNPKHMFVAAGIYAVKLTAASTSGSDSVMRNVTVASGPCPFAGWRDLKFATSAVGQELEAFHGDIPDPHPTLYSMIAESLDKRVRDLKAQVLAAAPNAVFTRLSGYRPPDYQDHLYQLKTLYEAMYKVRGSITAIQCASEIAKVEEEKIFHKLGPQKANGVEIPGTLAVNKRSNHEYGNALDVSVIPTPGDWAAAVRRNNLLEPCSERAVHLQTKENPVCGASTTVTALAFVQAGAGMISGLSVPLLPIRLLIRDPAGRRVGYDPQTGTAVNEIGETANYSGVDSDPQVVTVRDAAGGDYHVEAVAISSGAYTLMLSADDEEHGANFGSRSTTGNAIAGNPIEPLGLGVQQTTPQLPGRRRTVRH
jgi:PKD repeat protein